MAGFKTHITTSTVIGIGGAAAAYSLYQVPLPTCILAGGLCGVAGMMPDLDSGPGKPLRESMAFAAAVVPMMMIDRFKALGMSLEAIILTAGAMYLTIRFGVAALLRRYTVHRGMFHSLPAALIAGELTYLVFSAEDQEFRYFVSGAVVLGFMSHLILDELWSIEWHRGRLRFKASFGTALKLWGDSMGANFSTYAKVVLLTFLAVNDQSWMEHIKFPNSEQRQEIAERILDKFGLQNAETPRTLNIQAPAAESQSITQ